MNVFPQDLQIFIFFVTALSLIVTDVTGVLDTTLECYKSVLKLAQVFKLIKLVELQSAFFLKRFHG